MKTESIKTSLIDHAWAAVQTSGRQNLSVRYLTKRSQCALGGFYKFFESMDELIFHVNARSLTLLFTIANDHLQTALEDKNATLKSALVAIGEGYLSFAKSHMNLWKTIFESVYHDDIPDWYKAKVRELLKTIEDQLSAHFKLPEEKTHKTVTLFWAAIHGVCSIFINRKINIIDDMIDDDFIDFYLSHCIDGLI